MPIGLNRFNYSKHRIKVRSSVPTFSVLRPGGTGIQLKYKRKKSIWAKEDHGRGWRILFFLVCGLILLLATMGHAAPPQSRGARPISLGNGYTAYSGDGYALFYNPAGLYEITQQQFILDYGRSMSEGEYARSDFNGVYVMPWKWKENYVPLAYGLYGEGVAPGAHIINATVGAATDAPLEKWTKGFIQRKAKGGVALTIRQQHGSDISPRVGDTSLGFGLTAGLQTDIDRADHLGLAVRNLFPGDADPDGPTVDLGFMRSHTPQMTVGFDVEYQSGGIWRFKPGIEWILLRGVLRPRLGWGFRDNGGKDSVATGIGFYVSPVQIDIAYLIPIETLSDQTSQFRVSLIYRFGNPQFTEIYYDRALEAASSLDQNVLNLTVREAELKASLAELQQKLTLARKELAESKERIEILKGQDILGQKEKEIRDLKSRVRDLERKVNASRARARSLQRQKKEIRTHIVQPGDTLHGLAEKYYGDPNAWKKIYNANPDKFDRGLPRVGSKLVIP